MPTIAQLEKLLAADPADTFVLYGLAQEHTKAGNAAQAIVYYDRCLAADPAYCYAYFHKARIQEAAGDVAGAVRTLTEGVAQARKTSDFKALGEITTALEALT